MEVNFIALVLEFCTKIHSHHFSLYPTEFPLLDFIICCTICWLLFLICVISISCPLNFILTYSLHVHLLSSIQRTISACYKHSTSVYWLIGITDTHMLHIDDCSELRKIILEFNSKLNYCLGNFTFFSSEVTDCILYVKTINIYKNKKKANSTKMTSILIVM